MANTTKYQLHIDGFLARIKSLKLNSVQLRDVRTQITKQLELSINEHTMARYKKNQEQRAAKQKILEVKRTTRALWCAENLKLGDKVRPEGSKLEANVVSLSDDQQWAGLQATTGPIQFPPYQYEFAVIEKIEIEGKFVDIYKLAVGGL